MAKADALIKTVKRLSGKNRRAKSRGISRMHKKANLAYRRSLIGDIEWAQVEWQIINLK